MPSFTWGDEVRVRLDAQPERRPGAVGAVVAITDVDNDALASEFGAPIGSKLYQVEFGDGTAIEIPEVWLQAVKGDDE